MTTSFDAGAHRLGALSLRIADLLSAALTEEGRRSPSSAAALSAMSNFLDDPSIDQLSRVLGLTSSATVRLVDGLVAEGLAVRGHSRDGRVSAVGLTDAGRGKAEQLAASRAEILAGALSPLSDAERATLQALVGRILIGLIRTRPTRAWMCRLCDTATCGAERGRPCPVAQAALA